jgi:hypothetical protein
MKNREVAVRIVDDIIEDLSDRRGVRQEWDQIDRSIQLQIREQWITLTVKRIEES